jgi:hypothetical protein
MVVDHRYKLVLFLALWIFNGVDSFSQSLAAERKMRQDDTSLRGDTLSTSEQPDLNYRPENNIFINILGDASVASLNYERLFFTDPKHFFIAVGAGLGINYFVIIHNHSNSATTYSTEKYMIIPHHITGNIGKGRHFFEFGLGGAILAGPRAQPYLPYLTLGYRIQPWNKNRLHFRIFGSYPLQNLEKFEILYIPAGLSLGWSF